MRLGLPFLIEAECTDSADVVLSRLLFQPVRVFIRHVSLHRLDASSCSELLRRVSARHFPRSWNRSEGNRSPHAGVPSREVFRYRLGGLVATSKDPATGTARDERASLAYGLKGWLEDSLGVSFNLRHFRAGFGEFC